MEMDMDTAQRARFPARVRVSVPVLVCVHVCLGRGNFTISCAPPCRNSVSGRFMMFHPSAAATPPLAWVSRTRSITGQLVLIEEHSHRFSLVHAVQRQENKQY